MVVYHRGLITSHQFGGGTNSQNSKFLVNLGREDEPKVGGRGLWIEMSTTLSTIMEAIMNEISFHRGNFHFCVMDVAFLGHPLPREHKVSHKPFGEGGLHSQVPKLNPDDRCIT